MRSKDTVKNTITVATNAAFPTLRKGKAFKSLVFVASQVQKNLEPGSVHTVPISFLRDLLKLKLSTKELALMLEDLEKTKVDWSAYDSKYRGYSHVLSSCRYDQESESLTFSFDPLFIKEFLDRKTPFKNIPIQLVMNFKSNYALKIYELAYQYYDPKRKEGKTPTYTFEDLKKTFGVGDGQYNHRGHFFVKVINKPIQEAIELSDYNIEFHNNNRRGNARRYWFTIKLNPQAKFDFANVNNDAGSKGGSGGRSEKAIIEDRKRAEFFLLFWDEEFRNFTKKPMTDEERKLWLDPLLEATPRLNSFAEDWLISNFFKAPTSKAAEYEQKKKSKGIDIELHEKHRYCDT